MSKPMLARRRTRVAENVAAVAVLAVSSLAQRASFERNEERELALEHLHSVLFIVG